MATPPDGKRARNKRANRAAILEAARRCFLEHGYDAVTIRDVIRLSGLAAGTFYNYFPDKESLFRALVEARLGDLQDRIHAARERARDIESFFYESYLATLQIVRTDPDFFELMFRNEPIVRSFYNDNFFGLIMQSLKLDLQDAIVRGVVPELDVDALTAISFGAGYELARLIAQDSRRRPEDVARTVTDLFLHGLTKVADRPKLIRLGSRLLGGAAR
ncbi:MAG: TetR family transcriptional regulator [Sinimarinibacterium flocculans]|uniref:TetR family transcriptional regulator n=1 Tax=Sinimarinibacterium flocculans TaxID=985250 RepID=A0A318E9G4_9GAMM|nr:TetR/AcrR family transcriptional regulator [Sinimarinibacterium flocculans]MEC9362391.1 TetR/AcrR family transcriptional regulator [Pseudomonadota bacterium]PXV66090.1 TetR family transcriptional regulator [Sinimarinibacterium flocculans]